MKRLLVTILALSASACATAPEVYDFPKSRSINESKDVVWERVVEFFAVNNLAIKTIEKDSGIIAAERLISSPLRDTSLAAWASCGSAVLETPVRQNIDLNVFVRPQAGATSVTVNTRFNESRMALDVPVSVECNSNGRLEAMILDAASGR